VIPGAPGLQVIRAPARELRAIHQAPENRASRDRIPEIPDLPETVIPGIPDLRETAIPGNPDLREILAIEIPDRQGIPGR